MAIFTSSTSSFFCNINAIRGVSHNPFLPPSPTPDPETIFLWLSSFYDLSWNYNFVLAVLPSFIPETFSLNLLLLFLSAHCFVELHGSSSHIDEYICRMCTYSHDPSIWEVDSSGGPPDSSELVCVKQTHLVNDLLFHSVNKYLVMYLVHAKHHSKYWEGGYKPGSNQSLPLRDLVIYFSGESDTRGYLAAARREGSGTREVYI